jgi:hypothetical protein
MKMTLTVEIDYDPAITDPDSLACAMDRLLETALSTPNIFDDYGNPKVGEFFVAPVNTESSTTDSVVRRWVLLNMDTNELLTTRTYDSYDDAAEDANQVDDVLILPLVFEELHV